MENRYIKEAIEQAKVAYYDNEVPVGAVIVLNDEIIAKTHNMKLKTNNALNHAEILAIKEATEIIGDWRLYDCEMYVTLEPCPMCAGAIAQSRIKKVYIGTESKISSNKRIVNEILQNGDYYHRVDIEYLNSKECSNLLTSFFANKR